MRAGFVLLLIAITAIAAPATAQNAFGDSDPVDFTRPTPQIFPIHGIDAARFQDHIDWRRAKRAGVRFAFVKATEGGDLLDVELTTHLNGALRAGVPVGAYHFYYFCTPARVQARWFIRHVPKRAGMLPPVLDLEWNHHSPTCQHRPNGAQVRKDAKIFLRILENHYGQRPIIYTTPGFDRDTGITRLKGYDFWLRSTAKTPAQVYPGTSWRFWQYTGTGLIPGITGHVDINVFNGSRADWRRWLKTNAR
jgi:lysozyme